MNFSSRMTAFAAIPAVLFLVGLMGSIGALITTRTAFDQYIRSEQAVERGLYEMYAQGLQMGQALRNVVLDPNNPKAFENFKAAQTAYEKAYTHTREAATGGDHLAALERLPALRANQAKAQEKVFALVEQKADAIPTLNKEETPAWRELRAELLKQREDAAAHSAQAHQTVDARADFAVKASIALAVLALAVAVVLNTLLNATVRRELGGDPAAARAALAHIREGDLSSVVENRGAPDSLMGVLAEMQSALQQLVSGVRRTATGIATSTNEIAAGSQDLSDRTESQASMLETTAHSTREFGATVAQNADNAAQANQLAQEAAHVAAQGGVKVNQVVQTMQGINESSRKIADIIGVIDGIAFQTNILALNAAVEAARAGEQGRGFAVVASEVRSLAGRSAAAAKEIKELIGASVERVEQGSAQVNQAGETMAEVVSAITRVTNIMAEISAASSAQAQGVGQVGEAVTHMDHATQQNAALVEQMAAATANLKSQASELVQEVSLFTLPETIGGGSLQISYGTAASADSSVLGINMDNAIKAHADWRAKLRHAAQNHEQLDAPTIARDDCCELGKWLGGMGQSKCGGKPSFTALVSAHAGFHQEAGKVARAINQSDGADVERLLGSGSAFSNASAHVTRLIVQLRKECS